METFEKTSSEFFRSATFKRVADSKNLPAIATAFYLIMSPARSHFNGYGLVYPDELLNNVGLSTREIAIETLEVLDALQFLAFDSSSFEVFIPDKIIQTLGYKFSTQNKIFGRVIAELDNLPDQFFPFMVQSLTGYFKKNGLDLSKQLPSFNEKMEVAKEFSNQPVQQPPKKEPTPEEQELARFGLTPETCSFDVNKKPPSGVKGTYVKWYQSKHKEILSRCKKSGKNPEEELAQLDKDFFVATGKNAREVFPELFSSQAISVRAKNNADSMGIVSPYNADSKGIVSPSEKQNADGMGIVSTCQGDNTDRDRDRVERESEIDLEKECEKKPLELSPQKNRVKSSPQISANAKICSNDSKTPFFNRQLEITATTNETSSESNSVTATTTTTETEVEKSLFDGDSKKSTETDQNARLSNSQDVDNINPQKENGVASNVHFGAEPQTQTAPVAKVDTAPAKKSPPTKKSRAKRPFTAVAKPDDMDEDVWNDWIAFRKTRKAPITERVIQTFREEAQSKGWTLNDAVALMTAHGWQGCFLKQKEVDPLNPCGYKPIILKPGMPEYENLYNPHPIGEYKRTPEEEARHWQLMKEAAKQQDVFNTPEPRRTYEKVANDAWIPAKMMVRDEFLCRLTFTDQGKILAEQIWREGVRNNNKEERDFIKGFVNMFQEDIRRKLEDKGAAMIRNGEPVDKEKFLAMIPRFSFDGFKLPPPPPPPSDEVLDEFEIRVLKRQPAPCRSKSC